MRGIGGAWKWADLRPFRLVRGLSRIPNTALPCLDPFFSPFRAQARLCSWPGATCARARGWQGISFSRVAAPRCCSSRGVHHLGMQKRRRDGRRRAFLRCLLLCAVWRLSGGLAGLAIDDVSTRSTHLRRFCPSTSLGDAEAARREASGPFFNLAVCMWPGLIPQEKMAASGGNVAVSRAFCALWCVY